MPIIQSLEFTVVQHHTDGINVGYTVILTGFTCYLYGNHCYVFVTDAYAT